jgi:hypothetical protein
VGALVQQVGQVLARGHALFGDPATSGGVSGSGSGPGLAGAAGRVRIAQHTITGLSGAGPARYGGFAADATAALDNAAAADDGLGVQVRDAGSADRSGRASSGAVVTGAAGDMAGLSPVSGTAAGQRALVSALRARVTQQQQVVEAYKARDARLAALVRSLRYSNAGRGGATAGRPFGGMPMGGGGGTPSLPSLPGLSGLAGLTGGLGASKRAAPAASWPAAAAGTPLGALTPGSSQREVAAAIIHEARRRGYSPAQTTAILSTAMQESNLNPRSVSPNGLWVSIFQQDASYPGRRNPNLAIAEFFNRLDRHGGPPSADIWKSIFWLQQRPGEPSAIAAFLHGRQAYLREVQAQHGRAAVLYHDIVGPSNGLKI